LNFFPLVGSVEFGGVDEITAFCVISLGVSIGNLPKNAGRFFAWASPLSATALASFTALMPTPNKSAASPMDTISKERSKDAGGP